MSFRNTTGQDIPRETAPFWKRHRVLIGVVAAVVLASATAAPMLLRWSGAGGSVSRERVVIDTVKRGPFVRDFASEGKVVAVGSSQIYSPAAGVVLLQVKAGDAVTKDQVLATVNSPDLAAELAQERAALQGLELELGRARLEAQRSQGESEGKFAQAEVEHKTAERELERSRRAHELGSYSELQVLRAEDALEKARFQLEQARRERQTMPEQGRFEVAAKDSAVARQRAKVEELARRAAALELRSPVDGQVGQVLFADRSAVTRDAAVIGVIDLTALEVEIQVPESFARDLTTGMGAELSGAGQRWPAKVSGISPEVVSGQVAARLRFEGEAPQGLRQNQRLSARIQIDRRENVLTVRRGSFADRDSGRVYVVQDDVAVRRPVKLGAVSMSSVEILSGVQPGEQVVVSGTEAFNDADRVILSN